MSDTPGASPIPPPPPQPAASVPERPEAVMYGRRLARFAAGLALLMFVGVGVLWTAQYAILYESQLDTVERLRAAGLPMTYSQMAAMYEMPPDEENGALAYLEAYEIVKKAEAELNEAETEAIDQAKEGYETDSRLPDEAAAVMDAFLAKTDGAWDIIARAQRCPASVFPVDFSQGNSLSMPHLAPMRRLARLHHIRAMRAIERADMDDALDAIASCARLQAALQQEPHAIGYLQRIANIRINIRTAEIALSSRQLQADELNRITEAFDFEFGREDHIRALQYEFALAFDLQGPPDIGGSAKEDLAILRKAFGDGGRMYFANRLSSVTDLNVRLVAASHLLDVRDASLEPFPQQLATLGNINDKIDALDYQQAIAKVFVPVIIRTAYAQARLLAELDALRVAIDIERYRLATGALPDTLDALVPEYRAAIPIDPFDGQPLRYRLYPEGGYAVYSIGNDRNDDGAARERSLGDGISDGDIVIRVRR